MRLEAEDQLYQRNNRLFVVSQSLLAIAAITGLAVPLAFPTRLSHEAKLVTMGLGLVSTIAGAAISASDASERNQKLGRTLSNVRDQFIRGHLELEGGKAIAMQEIEAKRELAEVAELAGASSPVAAGYMAEQLDVQPFMPYVQPPVPSVEPTGDMASIPAPSGPQIEARNWEKEAVESTKPPFRDLAKDIASMDGHFAMASKTRSGKTTLLVAIVQWAQALGHEVYLIDGKGDERLRTLPNIHYLQCNSPDRVPGAEKMIATVLDELKRRQEPGAVISHPITLIVDENNLVRDSVMDSAPTKKQGAEKLLEYDRQLKRVVLQGAAAKIYGRFTAHTTRVEDWGWNTGVLDSLSFGAIARLGSFESIEDFIQYQLSGDAAQSAKAELSVLRDIPMDEPVMLTKLAPTGFYRIPNYGDIQSPVSSAPEIQSVDFHQACQVSEASTPEMDGQTAIAAMVEWVRSYSGSGQSLTQQAIRAKFQELTGRSLSDSNLKGLLSYIKGELSRGMDDVA